MITILFVISAVCVVMYLCKVITVCCGNTISTPMPIGHLFDVSYTNTYISSSSLAFQVWFWFSYAGVLS